MNHKGIMTALIVGFCIIFVGSLLGSISSFYVSRVTSEYRRADIDARARARAAEDYYDGLDRGNVLFFIEQLHQIIGGLVLSVFSAVGAFTIEDKYAKLGLLLFSALVTSFVLTTALFRMTSMPIYY